MARKNYIFKTGITMIIINTIMLITIPIWENRWDNVDFPCEWFGENAQLAKTTNNSRIVYCFSVYPRNAYGALPIYASSSNDSITINEPVNLYMQRQGNALIVNGQNIQVATIYNQHLTSFTLNPWLLATSDITLKNNGSLNEKENVLSISGDIKENWEKTPNGILFFIIGAGLLLLDLIRKKRKMTEIK